jgi:cysteine desulfurase
MTENYGNPSSRHQLGIRAATALADQRAEIAKAVGCRSEELFLTSGGTEGDNWAVFIAERLNHRRGKHIITTAIEHSAVLEPIRALEKQGYDITYLEPDRTGHITISQVESALRQDTILISMMLVNNETGAMLPVKETAQLIRRTHSPALLHTDAVQAFLKVPFTPKDLGVDFLTISAHKVGGLKGSGALYVKKGLKISPLILGGGQENGLRSGTESTPQIAAFSAACEVGIQHLSEHSKTLETLKAYALDTLQSAIPGLVVVSEGDAPHICAISLPGYPSEMLVRDLSDRGIYVSSGSACHKGKPSHVFAAMKLPPKVLMGILRLSFSPENTTQEVDALCEALTSIARERVPAKR